MKYAKIDAEGRATAFYDEQIHSGMIPKDTVKIDDKVWQQWLTTPDELAWDRKAGKLVKHVFLPVVTIEQIRARRAALLKASDWTQLADAHQGLSAAERAAWAKYRQKLRDLPDSAKKPSEIKWPKEPVR